MPGKEAFDLMTIGEVAEVLGVLPRTITQWMVRSLPTPDPTSRRPDQKRLYADHPFPAPTRYAGKSPEWARTRLPEIRDWYAKRPGRGAGGGRPRKVSRSGD